MRFHLVAARPIEFPIGTQANVLRGAFGATLKRIGSPKTYKRIFDPSSTAGPSGLADPPRPFVFRARELDGRSVRLGDAFEFGANLFDTSRETVACFVSVVSEIARLQSVERELHSINLDARPGRITKASVEFLTPTELKSGDRIAARPEFPILFARLRDRLSTLSALYGSGPLDIDFAAMGERASRVSMPRCEIHQIDVTRRSANTGQTHGIGGFVGSAEYEGELAEFLPYLEAARWTGVGRQTVWGKGELRVITR